MGKYFIAFNANGRPGDQIIQLDEPITEKVISEIKGDIAESLKHMEISCEASKIVILNWIKLEN